MTVFILTENMLDVFNILYILQNYQLFQRALFYYFNIEKLLNRNVRNVIKIYKIQIIIARAIILLEQNLVKKFYDENIINFIYIEVFL